MATSTGKSGATNLLAIVAVIVVVAGAAWYRAQRSAPVDETAGATQVGSTATAATLAGTATETAVGESAPMETSAVTTQPAAEVAKLPRLVDLGADKCVACKKLAPILDELREEYKGRLRVEFIDVWKNPDASEPYKIRLIPTQILYNAAGEEVWRHEGFIAKADLETLFAEKVGVAQKGAE